MKEEEIVVEVCASMDDLASGDLIYDALWVVAQSEDLSADAFDEILDRALWCEIVDEVSLSEEVSRDGLTYDKLMEVTSKLEDEAASALHEMFERLKTIVRDVLSEEDE